MKAFERINSGIPGLDKILDHIRLGDNVVFQVSELKGFRLFAEAFARQMIAEGRNMIYVRFSDHEPILEPMEGLRIIPVELSPMSTTSSRRRDGRLFMSLTVCRNWRRHGPRT